MMVKWLKVLLLSMLPLVLAGTEHWCFCASPAHAQTPRATSAEVVAAPVSEEGQQPVPQTLPRLVDIGATRCIPCRMMAPILDELREEYAGVVSVEFIDVLENPDAANAHAVDIIPTQVFFDAQGREVARHQGFLPREDILTQFEAMGISPPARDTE